MLDHEAKELESLSHLLKVGSGTECETQLALLDARIRDRLASQPGASENWLRKVGQLLLDTETALAAQPRVEILILLVLWFQDDWDSTFALRLVERAFEIASGAGAHSLVRRVLNVRGSVHMRRKEFPEATVSFVQALQLAEQIGDKLGRCAVISNLAALRVGMGMLDDAIKLNRFVLDLCSNDGIFRILRGNAHHNLAVVYLLLSDLSAAHEQMRLASGYWEEPGNHYEFTQRAVMEFTFVKVLAARGELEHARAHAEAATKYAAKSGCRAARIQSQLAVALVDSASGHSDIAFTRLAAAEAEVGPDNIAFRDVIETELFVNRSAGRDYDARYYNRKYLFSLAEFQRKSAIEHVAAAKRMLKNVEHSGSKRKMPERPLAKGEVLDLFAGQMESLAVLAELREDASGEHSFRVGRLAAMLASAVGYSDADATILEHAARLHDIGKLATPDAILLKRGKLSSSELEIMRRHPTEGCQILTDVLSTVEATTIRYASNVTKGLRIAAEVAQNHHEWWNGYGYPRGIAGSLIPESARIVALADVFDEMIHLRPYKKQYAVSDALKRIESSSGKQFEPRLCNAFLKIGGSLTDLQTPEESELSQFAAANRVIKKIVTSQARERALIAH